MQDFIPRSDALALGFLQTFAGNIDLSPATYQMSLVEAAALVAAVNLFAVAYADSIDPLQRSPVKTAVKVETRANCENLVRRYASLIKYNGGISSAAKLAIGVNPVNPARSRVDVPASSPLLNVIGATPGSQTVRYADSTTPDRAARPFGAASLQLFVAIAAGPVAHAEEAQFYGLFTKNPIAVGFDGADDGKVATYFARWNDRRGQTGPWSFPVSMRIAA